MKKKIILLGVLLILLAGAVISNYFINRNSVGADELNTFLNNSADHSYLNDPGLIRLPNKYSKEQIETALSNGVIKGKVATEAEAISSQILDEIDKIAKAKSHQALTKSGILDPATSELGFIVRVADSKGNLIIPTAQDASVKSQSATSVEDNFDFDERATGENKQLFYLTYSEIEKIYGARSGNTKIKVIYDLGEDGRSYYVPSNNEIHLDTIPKQDTMVHELVHSFHGQFCLQSLWEEGFAAKVTALVLKTMSDETQYEHIDFLINQGYADEKYANAPSFYSPRFTSTDTMSPYTFGSMTAHKLYLEDKEFFKKFNEKLYKLDKNSLSSQSLIQLTSTVLGFVEHERTLSWFGHQYPYIDYDSDYYNEDNNVGMVLSTTISYNVMIPEELDIEIYGTNRNISADDMRVTLYDNSDNILVEPSSFDIVSFNRGHDLIIRSSNIPKKYADYKGLMKVKAISRSDSRKNTQDYFIKTSSYKPSYRKMMVASPGVSDGFVKITNMDNGNNVFGKIVNGIYEKEYKDKDEEDWLSASGVFKVELFSAIANCTNPNLKSCVDQKILMEYHNLSSGEKRIYLKSDQKNECSFGATKVTSDGAMISFLSRANTNCGHTVFINEIPVKRAWTRFYSTLVSGVNLNTSYLYNINVAANYSKTVGSTGKVRTPRVDSYIKLVNVEDTGSIFEGTYAKKYTYSRPVKIDKASFSIENSAECSVAVDLEGCETIKGRVNLIDKYTITVTPEKKLYNNALYRIYGAGSITDKAGVQANVPNSLDWPAANLYTPLNPRDVEYPYYSLSKYNYSSSENVVAIFNFKSDELKEKQAKIKLFKLETAGDPTEITAKVSINSKDGSIIIKPEQALEVSGSYYVELPRVIDNNNNYVYCNELYFSVQ